MNKALLLCARAPLKSFQVILQKNFPSNVTAVDGAGNPLPSSKGTYTCKGYLVVTIVGGWPFLDYYAGPGEYSKTTADMDFVTSGSDLIFTVTPIDFSYPVRIFMTTTG